METETVKTMRKYTDTALTSTTAATNISSASWVCLRFEE